jgi:hypothetical protein
MSQPHRHIPLSQACSVEDIHLAIARDLSKHQASCAADRLLEVFLDQVLAPDEKRDVPSSSLLSDVRVAVVPMCNRLRPLVEDLYAFLVFSRSPRHDYD